MKIDIQTQADRQLAAQRRLMAGLPAEEVLPRVLRTALIRDAGGQRIEKSIQVGETVETIVLGDTSVVTREFSLLQQQNQQSQTQRSVSAPSFGHNSGDAVVEHDNMTLVLTQGGGCYNLLPDGRMGQQQQRPQNSHLCPRAIMQQQRMC